VTIADTIDGTLVHNVHGLVKISMRSAPGALRRQLRRRLGPSTGETGAEPDIAIRFTESLPTKGRLRFLGSNDAAYDDEHFYLLDPVGHRIRIDLEALGDRCEIVCERGVTSLPLLTSIIGMRLLRKGYVLLHSSAFVYGDKGVLVAGWEKGGKTEMLLAFMASGAAYVANEWTIVRADGGELLGLGGVVHIWDWHLRSLPRYSSGVSRSDRQRLLMLRWYRRAYNAVADGRAPRGAITSALHQLSLDGGVSLLGQVRVSPEDLFGDAVRHDAVALDRVFLATVGGDDVAMLPADPGLIARRMVASQAYERRKLFDAYQSFRFAFPDRSSDLLEGAHELEARLLSEAFSGKPSHEIVHPYPVPLDGLYRAAEPVCR
jgi:hypothetical protein